jgi:hypothetical protein
MSEREREAKANELKLNAARECHKLARYAQLAEKLLGDAHVFAMNGDFHAALELVAAAQRTAERVAGRSKKVFEWLLQAASLANELGVTETRPQTKAPLTGVEL